jgi:hypothetical protein
MQLCTQFGAVCYLIFNINEVQKLYVFCRKTHYVLLLNF